MNSINWVARAMKFNNITGVLAICGLISSANLAFATDFSGNLNGLSKFQQSNNLAAISQYQRNGVTWGSADASNFQEMLGDNFTIKTLGNRSIDLKLVNVIGGAPDLNRPSFLPRKQSIIAVFEASKSDEAWIAKSGNLIVDCWHHELGSEKILITAIKRRSGRYSIEFVLN